MLQRTDEMFPDVPPPPVEWVFDQIPEAEVVALLGRAGLTDAHREALLDRSRWTSRGAGWVLSPPAEVVREMGAAPRKAIYAVLGRSPSNPWHAQPFRLDARTFDGWLEGCGLPEEKRELLRRMTYAEGETVYFADIPLMESHLTREEILCLGKAISQTSTLLMNLRVMPDSDIGALASYWGRAGRGHAMKSFLASLPKVPGGCTVSVTYFFPAFARMRLFTYPDPRLDPRAPREDCFWTAMNFFRETPDDRFFDWAFTQQALRTEYVPIEAPRLFGDLILLSDERKRAVHLCVYVADDVVFTKNGADVLQPWVLMRIPEMMRRYTFGGPLETRCFRRKES
jgi:hypothetical protein